MTLHVRPAGPRDARLLWEWRNDPSVRANSFNSNPISWKDHKAWYARKLASTGTRIYVLEDDREEALGQIRFERRDSEMAEINLAIAPDFRGRGFGRTMLKRTLSLAHAELGVQRFEALVKHENAASSRLFRATGFTAQQELVVAGSPCVRLVCVWPPCGSTG